MLAVEAAMRMESSGLRMRIDGSGSRIILRLDAGAASLFQALRRSGSLLAGARASIPYVVRCGLRVDVFFGSILVGSAGPGVAQNAPARFLRLPFTRIGA